MLPVKFEGCNSTYVGENCIDLPAQSDGEKMLTQWLMSWRDRIAAVLFGRVWVCILGNVHPPIWVRCEQECRE